MRSTFTSVALMLAGAAVAACGDSSGTGGEGGASEPPQPITFAEMGSLVSSEGQGSFRFGAATAATQIEDANENTDWWVFTAPEPEGLGKGKAPVGDASRGYTLAEEDIQLLVELGLDSYRFSIEWGRIEPQRDVIDEEALDHYSDFIDALLAAGIRADDHGAPLLQPYLGLRSPRSALRRGARPTRTCAASATPRAGRSSSRRLASTRSSSRSASAIASTSGAPSTSPSTTCS
jgi:hypothetical protein